MNLNFGLTFTDLDSLLGLQKLDQIFLDFLQPHPELLQKLYGNRQVNIPVDKDFLVLLAPLLDDFIAELFSIQQNNLSLKQQQKEFDIIYECRRKFVQRVWKSHKHPSTDSASVPEARNDDFLSKLKDKISVPDQLFAEKVVYWLSQADSFKNELDLAAAYAIYMVKACSSSPLFTIPRVVDPDNLIRQHRIAALKADISLGFDYRDNEIGQENALAQAKYCLYCHHQQKDSCRFGLQVKDEAEKAEKGGCPLDQKISEMNQLYAQGYNIGALAVAMIDNPLVCVTGHRICNDCMKACIFQKQDPVNIPLIESTILNNVLHLPFGAEIYLLLSRWNPLNCVNPLPKEHSGYNVLVAGLGPAGFALSHYLCNEGHNVFAIDGLKIEPLNFDPRTPIENFQLLARELSKRVPQGFGGVTEYGITHRWDKNNLLLVRIMLERRSNFSYASGIRLGSNLAVEDVDDLGFDHLALCIGAGRPKYLSSSDYFRSGIKSAADFLMNLQQGGCYLPNSNSNLQIRLPVVVIGCGLSAIDAAVETLHYYPLQVEKFLRAVEENKIDISLLGEEERIIADEFMTHAKFLRKAADDNEKLAILQALGGVSICYRKTIAQSPAYLRNHEEIEHAMAIGVKFYEQLEPLATSADEFGCVKEIRFRNNLSEQRSFSAKTILIAVGTENNDFTDLEQFIKAPDVSYFGDCNPAYSGSVVKALASVKNGFHKITKQLQSKPTRSAKNFEQFAKDMQADLSATIFAKKILGKDYLEITIKAPLAVKNYKVGQVYRLQNINKPASLSVEPIALSPFKVEQKEGLVSFVIKNVGNSTKLCSDLEPSQPVILMGPSGSEVEIPDTKNLILIGRDIRNLALLPLAVLAKEKGIKVSFIAHYGANDMVLHQALLEQVSDKIIFSGSVPDSLKPRAQDEVIEFSSAADSVKYAVKNDLISLKEAAIFCYLNNQDLTEMQELNKNLLAGQKIMANLAVPMQCMMKGICGQCIVSVKDSHGYLFACACQNLTLQNFAPEINEKRLKVNSLLEKIQR